VLSQLGWGNEMGKRVAFPHSDVSTHGGGAMARTGKLSAVEVAKAKGPTVLHDGGGLYLRVSGTGTKSWVFRFQLDGKRHDMGLGPYLDISLAEARRRATEHRKQRHDGIDPLAAKAAERQAQRLSEAKGRTFREVAEEFIARNEVGGATPSTASNGGIPSPLTSTRFWGNYLSPRSTPGWLYRFSIRFGRRNRRQRAGCEAASRRCSTLPRCEAFGRVRTRPSGKAISSMSSPRAPGYGRWRTCRTTIR